MPVAQSNRTTRQNSTRQRAKRVPNPRFSSGHLVIITIGHNMLKEALREAGGPDVSSFCILLNAALAMPDGLPQADVSKVMRIRTNTAAKVLASLESNGLVTRRGDEHDGRARMISITPAGESRLAVIEEAIEHEFDVVVPANDKSITAMENALANAAVKAGVHRSDAAKTYPYGFILACNEIAVEIFESTTKDLFGISLNEARILQVLFEEKNPMRIGDVAEHLQIPNATTTRSVATLVQQGLISRLADPEDKKAIYITLTEKGTAISRRVVTALNRTADEYLWENLTARQKQLLSDTKSMVLHLIERAQEQERQAILARLTPLD
jgi:DNA-binding MarR family transcriptional regulator